MQCSTTQQTLIAPPRLTGDIPGEHPELIRPSSSHQTTARPGQRGGVARKAIREFGSGPGCAFWLMKEPVGGGGSPLPSDIQTALSARSRPGCRLGGACVTGLLWPNRGAGFGPQRIAFRSSPHPSPGAYKRSSAEPLECVCLTLLQNIIGMQLPSRTLFFFESLILGDCRPSRLPTMLSTSCRATRRTSAARTLQRAPANN